MRVSDVRVGGGLARETALAEDGTVLRVVPERAVPAETTVKITLSFVTRLPAVRARSGYAGSFHMVSQWFPKIGVRDRDGTWHCHPYHLASEFYADFGVYRVTVEVPRGFDVAASGRRVKETRGAGGGRLLHYLAEDVHDFAWAAGRSMQRLTRTVGAVTLQAVHFGDPRAKVKRHLELMARSLELLERWLGPYPYPTLTAVLVPDAAEQAGGMEYPTLFTTSTSHAPMMERFQAHGTTVHELVHQYFYGLLASNEHAEPWLDEGFTTYVSGLVLDRIFGRDRSALEVGPFKLGYFPLTRIWVRMAPDWDPAQQPAPAFADARSYFTNVYGRPCLALRTLERQIGWPRMRGLLRDYVANHRFTHPRGEDFFGFVDRHVPDPGVRRFFRQAIQTSGVLDYEVAKLYALRLRKPRGLFNTDFDRTRRVAAQKVLATLKTGYENRVLIHRRGELTLPITVELRFADGSRVRRRWDGQQRWHWLVVPHRSRVTSAVIDPDGTLALERSLLNNGRRTKPDARPARRVTGRLLGLLQLVLQLVGF